jgi:pimeloyl-ACP methyl ester carboxylesterase
MTPRFARAADGAAIAYDDWNPGAAGPAIVLVHGLGAAGRQFDADAAFFSERGRRVLVPDLRGHARSRVAGPARPEGFTIPLLAADLEAMLADAGVARCHFVGNSLGGILGLWLLGRRPDLFTSFASFGTAHGLRLPAVSAWGLPLVYRILGPRLAGRWSALATTRNAAARPLIAACLEDFDPEVGRAVTENVRRYDLLANAIGFAGPMLVLRGAGDAMVNRALAKTLPALAGKPGFALVELPRGGHCANLDDTEAFRAALLAFWAKAEGVRPAPAGEQAGGDAPMG